jgi:hypothetical protein
MSGLALSTTTQLVLLWASRLPEYNIVNVPQYQFLLGFYLYGAIGFLISAVYVLVLSVQELGYPAHPPTNAHLVFTTAPGPPTNLALSVRFFPFVMTHQNIHGRFYRRWVRAVGRWCSLFWSSSTRTA